MLSTLKLPTITRPKATYAGASSNPKIYLAYLSYDSRKPLPLLSVHAPLENPQNLPIHLQPPSQPSSHGSRSQDHHRPLLCKSLLPPLQYTPSVRPPSSTSTTNPCTTQASLRPKATNPVPQVLAIGFLLVILSCALDNNYLPLLVVATYVVAPLPNWICGRCANPDDFMESAGNGIIDFGRWLTGFFVVMGIGRCDIFYVRGGRRVLWCGSPPGLIGVWAVRPG